MVPGPELEAVEAELPNHIQRTLAEPGCISFSVLQSPNDPCRFDVEEEFYDRQAFEPHQRRVKDSFWGNITKNVKRYYEIKGETPNDE